MLKVDDLIVLLIALLILFLMSSIYILKYGVRVSPHFVIMISDLGSFEYVYVLCFILVFIPFFEEILFRKYFFESLRSRYYLSIAILITVISETILHMGYEIKQLLVIAIYSLYLTFTYLKSRLATTIILHFMINILFLFFFNFLSFLRQLACVRLVYEIFNCSDFVNYFNWICYNC